MAIYQFREFDGINQTPAICLIARAWPEMIAQGIAPNEGISSWDHQAIVAFSAELPVGVITYTHEKWRRLVWVHLGYVIPELRRHGIYRMLWDRVIKSAQKLGAVEIHGGTHVDNVAMLECVKRLGRRPISITTRFVVPPAKAAAK
jgi:GNAT superfamily N-acetyltransferase